MTQIEIDGAGLVRDPMHREGTTADVTNGPQRGVDYFQGDGRLILHREHFGVLGRPFPVVPQPKAQIVGGISLYFDEVQIIAVAICKAPRHVAVAADHDERLARTQFQHAFRQQVRFRLDLVQVLRDRPIQLRRVEGQGLGEPIGLPGNNGTVTGATWTALGKFGNALTFNGTSALVTIPSASSLQLTTAMTLEAWVEPTAANKVKTRVLPSTRTLARSGRLKA